MEELLGELLTVPLVYAIGVFIIINNEGWEGSRNEEIGQALERNLKFPLFMNIHELIA